MSDAPKTIWIDEFGGRCFGAGANLTQYTRTDTIPAQDDLICAALEAAAKAAEFDADDKFAPMVRSFDEAFEAGCLCVSRSIRALADNPEALAAIKAKAEGRG